MPNIVVNHIDVDSLPEKVQEAMLQEFSKLPIKSKLIVYSKLIHGHLFKVTSNDFFNINKQTPGVVYRSFIKSVASHFNSGGNNGNNKRKTKSVQIRDKSTAGDK